VDPPFSWRGDFPQFNLLKRKPLAVRLLPTKVIIVFQVEKVYGRFILNLHLGINIANPY